MSTSLLYAELAYKIRGCVFQVYYQLGFGHKEHVYHKALAIEFDKQVVPFEEEKSIDVLYKNLKVGTYRPDFVIDKKVIIEIKSVPFLTKDAET